FIDSSLAYQGYARGLGMEEVFQINQFAIQDVMPNLTLLFDIAPKKGLERIAANKNREKNRLDLEEIAFHEKVYEGYQLLHEQYPNRIQKINANQAFQDVERSALDCILAYLK